MANTALRRFVWQQGDLQVVVQASVRRPACAKRGCRYYGRGPNGKKVANVETANICPAYPDGIPIRIQNGSDSHSTIQPDQVGAWLFKPGVRGNPGRSGGAAESTRRGNGSPESKPVARTNRSATS